MLCLLLYHYPNLTLGLHRNLFSVPVDLPSVRPVELLASSGSDQLSAQLRLPPTSSMPQGRQNVSTSPITSQPGKLVGLPNAPLSNQILNVQSPRFSQIRSILYRPVANLPAFSKLPVPSNRSLSQMPNAQSKSSVQLKISPSRQVKYRTNNPSNSSLCLFIPVPSLSKVKRPKIKSC